MVAAASAIRPCGHRTGAGASPRAPSGSSLREAHRKIDACRRGACGLRRDRPPQARCRGSRCGDEAASPARHGARSTAACGRWPSYLLDRNPPVRRESCNHARQSAPRPRPTVQRLTGSWRSRPACEAAIPADSSISAETALSVTPSRRGPRTSAGQEKSTALATSTALPAAEASGSFMPVTSADAFQACAVRDRPRRRLLASADGIARLFHEGAVADLHVKHQRLQPGRQLLRQDRGGDQRHRIPPSR